MPLFNTKIKSLPNEFIYHQNTLSPQKSLALYQHLIDHCRWQQPQIQMFGKQIPIPRLQCYLGDPEATYQYSGLLMQPEPWPEVLLAIKARLSSLCDTPFNALLVNWYRNGQDSMGWHSDDEVELGMNPTIASLPLGETRLFKIRNKKTKQVIDLPLSDGDCLIMVGRSQQDYQHSLPKQNKVLLGRLNLTFRYVKP